MTKIFIESIQTQGGQVCLDAGVGLKAMTIAQPDLSSGVRVSLSPLETRKQILSATVCEPAWSKYPPTKVGGFKG
jgi:hypothetical protein